MLSIGWWGHALLGKGFAHINNEVRAPDQHRERPTPPFGDENIDSGGVDEGMQGLIAPATEGGERLFLLRHGCPLQQKVAYEMRKKQTHHQESIYRIHGGGLWVISLVLSGDDERCDSIQVHPDQFHFGLFEPLPHVLLRGAVLFSQFALTRLIEQGLVHDFAVERTPI